MYIPVPVLFPTYEEIPITCKITRQICLSLRVLLQNCNYYTWFPIDQKTTACWRPRGGGGGRFLRYISDGDVRSPFLGLKFAIWGPFLGLKFCSDYFWVRDFGKDFFGELTKSKTQGSRFYVKQLYQFHLLKKGGRKNCLEFSSIIIIFLIGLFLDYVLGHWPFFGPGTSLKDFFGSYNFASFVHPCH